MHSSVTRSMELFTISSPFPEKLGREDGSLMKVMCCRDVRDMMVGGEGERHRHKLVDSYSSPCVVMRDIHEDDNTETIPFCEQ